MNSSSAKYEYISNAVITLFTGCYFDDIIVTLLL